MLKNVKREIRLWMTTLGVLTIGFAGALYYRLHQPSPRSEILARADARAQREAADRGNEAARPTVVTASNDIGSPDPLPRESRSAAWPGRRIADDARSLADSSARSSLMPADHAASIRPATVSPLGVNSPTADPLGRSDFQPNDLPSEPLKERPPESRLSLKAVMPIDEEVANDDLLKPANNVHLAPNPAVVQTSDTSEVPSAAPRRGPYDAPRTDFAPHSNIADSPAAVPWPRTDAGAPIPQPEPLGDRRPAELRPAPLSPDREPIRHEPPNDPLNARDARQPMPPAPPPQRTSEKYVVEPNDSYWTISQKVYGTPAYFKAIHEYNRQDHPKADRLTVGEELRVPDVAVLQRAYPDLTPKQRKPSAGVGAHNALASARLHPGRTYVVREGDTLFDIAKFQLGKASRWSEIFEINRETLGDDFDYLRPGTKLILPSDEPAGERPNAVTRQPGDSWQR